MRTGKISESVLMRSVIRQINHQENERVKGAGIGEDCAFLSYEKDGSDAPLELAASTETIAFPAQNAGYLAMMASANNLAAGGAAPEAALLSILLPAHVEEETLRELQQQANQCCAELGMQLAGGHTEVSTYVNTPVITATAFGRKKNGRAAEESGRQEQRPERMELVVSKWIAMEGTAVIAKEKEAELCGRYSPRFVREAQKFGEELSVAPEAAIALKSNVYAMHDMRNGGIFGALWEISRKMNVGLTIDLKKIPVRQETIEICEVFDLNPYELLSGGMLLMATESGEALVEELGKAGITATVIGSTNSGNDKIVINQGETRYLEPPAADEIYKIFSN